jgi:hypothetical protein
MALRRGLAMRQFLFILILTASVGIVAWLLLFAGLGVLVVMVSILLFGWWLMCFNIFLLDTIFGSAPWRSSKNDRKEFLSIIKYGLLPCCSWIMFAILVPHDKARDLGGILFGIAIMNLICFPFLVLRAFFSLLLGSLKDWLDKGREPDLAQHKRPAYSSPARLGPEPNWKSFPQFPSG